MQGTALPVRLDHSNSETLKSILIHRELQEEFFIQPGFCREGAHAQPAENGCGTVQAEVIFASSSPALRKVSIPSALWATRSGQNSTRSRRKSSTMVDPPY